jgi:acetyltransferase-like isoleucine patch superfamily enzyme
MGMIDLWEESKHWRKKIICYSKFGEVVGRVSPGKPWLPEGYVIYVERDVLIDETASLSHHVMLRARCVVEAHAIIYDWVKVMQDVRIGSGALIRRTTTIGFGAVVPFGKEVRADVPPLTLT